MSQRVKIGFGVFVVASAAGFAAWFFWPQPFVPQEFSEARIRGAVLAQAIVGSAGESLDALARIRLHDEQKEVAGALIVISQEIIRNRDAQEKAIKLSSELERMARLITNIHPERARLMAAEAVSAEVALVSRLVSYNDNLLELFSILREKFEYPGRDTNGRVDQLIDTVNEEARAINMFNQRFNWSLAEFDKMFVN